MDGNLVVVGVDGSPESMVALHWAAMFASPEAKLLAVRAWDFPVWSAFPSPLGGYPVPPADEMEAAAREQLATAAELVDRDIDIEVIRGEAAASLIQRAGTDGVIVVGTHGYGAVRDWLSASVSTACAAHADCPVIVVPSSAEITPPRRVVVGVDGSENSHWAVRWALDNVPAPTPVKLITAWDTPVLYGYDPMVPDSKAYEDAARSRLDSVCDALSASGSDCSRLQPDTVRGDPRTVLAHAGDDADLLVVGSHGHGAIRHLMMGSVASPLVHKPRCPLAVVRAKSDPVPTAE